MQENQQTQARLPAPKWCFVLLGVATFSMLAGCLSFTVWAVVEVVAGVPPGQRQWMKELTLAPAVCVTLGLWSVYIAWIGLSARLTRCEKTQWLFIVLFLNHAGMPMFYVFMLRRYLGLEGRASRRDENSLSTFLRRHGINREQLSSDQMAVLRSYCRERWLTMWLMPPLIAMSVILLYTGLVSTPKAFVEVFADLFPTRVVVVDSAKASREQIGLDDQTQKDYVQNVMRIGIGAGVTGTMGLFMVTHFVFELWGSRDRRTLVKFLKVTGRGRSPDAPT